MRYLLLIFAIWAIIAYLRYQHRRVRTSESKQEQSPTPQPMIRCPVCGVHVPKNSAINGTKGQYCSEEHARQQEQ